ncbi:MAG: amine oxidase [Bacteroidetes bacterium]|nr:MAG: amine oxidase [Bacteroidota bacterium]
MRPASEKKRVAVIGGGVAGIVSAWQLRNDCEVSLFECNDYLGGHTNTVTIPDGPDAGLGIDTGFIVLNDRTYPNFRRFLNELEVPTRDSEMSFSFQCDETGFTYAGNSLKGLFAQRANLVKPSFYRFLFEIVRFSRNAQKDLREERIPQLTLGEYLQRGGYSRFMIDHYLLPMAAAIWSTPTLRAADFPAGSFLHFFANHGLLDLRDRPQWMTVVGGSHAYVKAFRRRFNGQVELQARIATILRDEKGVRLVFEDGHAEEFDRVVVATHADQALKLLGDADKMERRLLGAWRYQPNHTVLHTDIRLLPRLPATWSAWNFVRARGDQQDTPVYVSYCMNILQGLKTEQTYIVTLNHQGEFAPGSVIARFDYQHPQYDFASITTQKGLPGLNGRRHTWFCGSYFGYGFHEDAVRSAVAVAESMRGTA